MQESFSNNFLPVSINIANKKIVIIGGGRVGFHKATLLNRFTDEVTVISPEFQKEFDRLPFRQIKKKYDMEDIKDAFLIYICTENEELNARIKRDAEELDILASVCDNPTLCDFTSPAIYKQDNITIAVASNTRNVRQSIAIRNQIRHLVEEGILKIEENDTLQTH